MKYIVVLLCLAGLPLLGQPTGNPKDRQAKAEQKWEKNRQRAEETVFNNRVNQEVERRLNVERQAAQTVAVQAQQAAVATYGGYNRAPQPLYHVSQEGAVAIAQKMNSPAEILKLGIECRKEIGERSEKYCKDLTKEALDETGNVFRSARKAVPRPPAILIPRYGW